MRWRCASDTPRSRPSRGNSPPGRIRCSRRLSDTAALADDGVYLSQFVTGISNGKLSAYPGSDPDQWERRWTRRWSARRRPRRSPSRDGGRTEGRSPTPFSTSSRCGTSSSGSVSRTNASPTVMARTSTHGNDRPPSAHPPPHHPPPFALPPYPHHGR
ncbi:DUF3626 domain-containing protein [Micromonospora sp. WMMD1120]|uniref:DUF3626 domain-containing protein n=1 Tax=Micromonospora sp. WMMD1120 TaxID=3016106 RepID=UPI0024172073|nr:DUF3626 domain-containing protein [Micromonospora sp. WMMD1120]MDG4809786.1 DUF3626 domain-containing protein [Micromonospora sp. WMMD1120]